MSSLIPYEVHSFENGLRFITDTSITYQIVFEKHTAFYELGCQSFEFSFYPIGQQSIDYDPRISITIFKVIHDFFESRPDCVLLYVCDSSENRARARNILFNRWFGEVAPSAMVKLNRKIIDTDLDMIYYVAFIFNQQYIPLSLLEANIDAEIENLNK